MSRSNWTTQENPLLIGERGEITAETEEAVQAFVKKVNCEIDLAGDKYKGQDRKRIAQTVFR